MSRDRRQTRELRRSSIIFQVAVLFALCVLVTGMLTYINEFQRAGKQVSEQIESKASVVADEVIVAVHEYPAYEWLMEYWHDNWDKLDIEYDAIYSGGKETRAKYLDLITRHPDMPLRYATVAEIEALPPEDQKIYAEITYSWLIDRIDQIKKVNQIDYLFCVRTEEPYDKQFFMFSAADPGAVRGTEYEQVYTLGVTVEVSDSQQTAMQNAVRRSSHMADAGSYMDYYAYMGRIGGHVLLIGMTYNLSDILSAVETETQYGSVSAMIYQIILSLICLTGIYYFVLKPLKKVQANIRSYKDTKDSKAVAESLEGMVLNNEISELASDVVDLSKEIDAYLDRISTISSERERIRAELSLASEIQSSVLPSEFPPFPDRSEFDIYALMDPAREVGGDFYDFFMIDDDHLCLSIADVSGKGVPAALFMMRANVMLKSYAMLGKGPAEILENTNNALIEDNVTDMFVTVWIGILEISTGKLTAANAGHEYPIIRNPGGQFELFRDKHGIVLGALEDQKYSEYELTLQAGSTVFVYTDGVTEAPDVNRAMFGTERILQTLNSEPDADPKQLIINVRKAVKIFKGEAHRFDDLTILCFEYRGTEKS